MTPVSIAVRTRPTSRLTKVPPAMMAPARPTLGWVLAGLVGTWSSGSLSGPPAGGLDGGSDVIGWPLSAGGRSRVAGEALPRHPRDPALVGERQVAVRLAQREPGDVDGLVVGVVLDRQVPADGLEEVVVDVLVDAPLARGEPVVDGAELDEDDALDARLLGHLAGGGLGERLLALDVA